MNDNLVLSVAKDCLFSSLLGLRCDVRDIELFVNVSSHDEVIGLDFTMR